MTDFLLTKKATTARDIFLKFIITILCRPHTPAESAELKNAHKTRKFASELSRYAVCITVTILLFYALSNLHLRPASYQLTKNVSSASEMCQLHKQRVNLAGPIVLKGLRAADSSRPSGPPTKRYGHVVPRT